MKSIFLLSLCFFLVGNNCFAQNTWSLLPNQMNTPPKNTFEVIKGMGSRSLQEIMPLSFQPIEKEFPNFGISKDTIWLKFTLQSMASEETEWLLEIDQPSLYLADFYIQDSLAQWQVFSVGYMENFGNRRVFHQNPNLSIRLKASEKKTVYLRTSGLLLIMPFRIATTEILQESHTPIHLSYGIYYGLVLFVLLTNLFSLFVYKNKVYLFYSVYVMASILFTSCLTGYYFWLTADYPIIYNYSIVFFGLMVQVNMALFLIRFLKLDYYSPFRKKILAIYSVIVPISYIFIFTFFEVYEAILLDAFFANVITFLGMEAAWKAHKKGHATAIYFFIAYLFFVLGLILFSTYIFSLVNHSWAKYSYDWAALCEMILISIALSVQQNIDKEKAQKDALFQAEENRRLVQEQNVVLEQKVKERTAEIVQQKEEITQTLEIVNQQKHEIEKSHKHITDSINYAKKIQTAFLPKQEIIENTLPNSFILYLPRDIVSGDFYWIRKVDNLQVIIAADCTGHGVPGAFLSILGTTLLNDIIVSKKILKPNEILDELRIAVINSLNQYGTTGENKDGMDISVCVYNPENNILEYAGANNSLYIIRQNKLIEYKADHQPVGKHIKEKPFTLHEIQLKSKDSIYSCSDGYSSQFGGQSNDKLKRGRFKEYLLTISELAIVDQKNELENMLKIWQGDNEQIDDILVIGVKIA